MPNLIKILVFCLMSTSTSHGMELGSKRYMDPQPGRVTHAWMWCETLAAVQASLSWYDDYTAIMTYYQETPGCHFGEHTPILLAHRVPDQSQTVGFDIWQGTVNGKDAYVAFVDNGVLPNGQHK